jgi:hypothetical protein
MSSASRWSSPLRRTSRSVREVYGGSFSFSGLRAAYAAPAHGEDLQTHFPASVHFGRRAGNELGFDAAWINHPAVRPDPITSVMAGELCEHFLDGVNHDGGIVSDIRRALAEHPGQFPSIEKMAAGLSIHPRTLRRKLETQQMTYLQIVDEIRMKPPVE